MAAKLFRPVQCVSHEIKILPGSFNNDLTTLRGKGFTVAKTATGTYVVTLDSQYFDCVSAVATLQMSTPDGSTALLGAIDVKSAKTVTFITKNSSGTTADLASGSNVNFVLYLANQSLT